jgi:hypothetical protein
VLLLLLLLVGCGDRTKGLDLLSADCIHEQHGGCCACPWAGVVGLFWSVWGGGRGGRKTVGVMGGGCHHESESGVGCGYQDLRLAFEWSLCVLVMGVRVCA